MELGSPFMTQPSDPPQPLVEYRLLDNGIHVFVVHDETTAAADMLITMLEGEVNAAPSNQIFRYIVDLQNAVNLPMAYTVRRTREKMANNRARPVTRGAHMQGETALGTIAQVMLSMLVQFSKDEVRFFHTDEYEAAVAWVLEK